MVEILLLGTPHLSGADILDPVWQKDMNLLSDSLMEFRPDAIAVESRIESQKDLDQAYRYYCGHGDPESKDASCGTVYRYGKETPLLYSNEIVQIAFRLGKRLRHDQIYAVDEEVELNDHFSERSYPIIQSRMDKLIEKNSSRSIMDRILLQNSPEHKRMDHQIYMELNKLSFDNLYDGADWITDWYNRNLKIFANLQRLADQIEQKGEHRLFALYGSGHLSILEHLIHSTEGMKWVNPLEVIR